MEPLRGSPGEGLSTFAGQLFEPAPAVLQKSRFFFAKLFQGIGIGVPEVGEEVFWVVWGIPVHVPILLDGNFVSATAVDLLYKPDNKVRAMTVPPNF